MAPASPPRSSPSRSPGRTPPTHRPGAAPGQATYVGRAGEKGGKSMGSPWKTIKKGSGMAGKLLGNDGKKPIEMTEDVGVYSTFWKNQSCPVNIYSYPH